MPVVAISFLNCLTFGLPVKSGERITMCISLFLAYIFMLNILADSQPRTSEGISLLGIYINIQLVSSIITVTLSIFSLHSYHKGSLSSPRISCFCKKDLNVTKNNGTAKVNETVEINENEISNDCEKNKLRNDKTVDFILLRCSCIFQALLLLCMLISVLIMKSNTN